MKKITKVIIFLSMILYLNAADMNHSMHSQHGMTMEMGNTPVHEMKHNGDLMVMITSEKPLVNGRNELEVMLIDSNNELVSVEKVKMKVFMPEMPGMPYMEYTGNGKLIDNKYKIEINFGMGGTWQYQLKYKKNEGSIHSVRGSFNI